MKRIIVDFSWVARKIWYVRGKPQDVPDIMSDIMMSVLKIIKDDKYESEVILAFDGSSKGCGRRYRDDESYKGGRNYGPEYEAFFSALVKLFEVLPKLGIKCVMFPGVEADDLQYLLSSHEDYDDLLFAIDRDWLLSVADNPRTTCFRPGTNKQPDQLVDREEMCREFDLDNASDYLHYKCVVGDGSDNIKGISLKGMPAKYHINAFRDGNMEVEDINIINRNISLMRLDRIITDDEVIKEVISQLGAVDYANPDIISGLLVSHRPYMSGVLEQYNRLRRDK